MRWFAPFLLVPTTLMVYSCRDCGNPETRVTEKSEAGMQAEEKILEIAQKAAEEHVTLTRSLSPIVRLSGGVYTVTFPKKLGPTVRGADYDAEVRVDGKTGKVLQVLVGS